MAYVEHRLFVCDCESVDHQLIVSKFTYEQTDEEDVVFTVGLTQDLPFFERLRVALRYLFGRNQPQVEVILSPDKVRSLVDCLQDS